MKALQAALLCSELRAFAEGNGLSPEEVPCVVGGDLNSLWRKRGPDLWDPVNCTYEATPECIVTSIGYRTVGHLHETATWTCAGVLSSCQQECRQHTSEWTLLYGTY